MQPVDWVKMPERTPLKQQHLSIYFDLDWLTLNNLNKCSLYFCLSHIIASNVGLWVSCLKVMIHIKLLVENTYFLWSIVFRITCCHLHILLIGNDGYSWFVLLLLSKNLVIIGHKLHIIYRYLLAITLFMWNNRILVIN